MKKNTTVKMSGAEIYNWVKKTETDFYLHSGPNVYCKVSRGMVRLTNIRNGKTAYAKCHTSDEFDITVGKAIAWARYCKRPIPEGM